MEQYRARVACVLSLICVLGLVGHSAIAQTESRGNAAPATYTHDCYGLEREIQPFLDANAVSSPDLDATLAIFQMPDTGSWFAAHFASDQAQQMAADQKAQTEMRGRQMANTLAKFPGNHFRASCADMSKDVPSFPPRPDALHPTVDFTVERYELAFVADGNANVTFTQEDNFVYVDGAFRFVGGGFYPFWSMPAVVDDPSKPPVALDPAAARAAQADYADSAAGLKRLIQDFLKLAKQNDQTRIDALTASMVLPNKDAWFSQVFGLQEGPLYAKVYASQGEKVYASQGEELLPDNLRSLFRDAVTQQFTFVDVDRFTKPCDSEADESAYPVLLARVGQAPLSQVRLSRGDNYKVVRYFAYVDGAFRFLGDLPPNPDPPFSPGSAADAQKPVNTSGPSSPPTVINKEVAPQLPEQGAVELQVLISATGVPADFRVLKGSCANATAAISAVRKWQFKPGLVKGTPEPMGVKVNFRVGR
jgi:TonB family protein